MQTKLVNKEIRNNYTNELLKERGLSEEELNYFLNVPDDSALQHPSDLANIEKANFLFDKMINSDNCNICIVVDSDVDGFTSAAIFIQYLRKFNQDIGIIAVLHEGKGHGLSDTIDKIFKFIEQDMVIKYVVLPDAGSNDYDYI